ncbi:hypothetical protein GGF46_000788 [Coemansia sp. RSA 552]|nr:hypothetical protein GGF46_000788 [Coemansia sp. RSA 552]
MDPADNRQRQQDEILALEAIYGEKAVERCAVSGGDSFVLHAPLDALEVQVDLRFHLPDSYPSDSPPVFEWIGARDMSAEIRGVGPGFVFPARQLVFSEAMHRAASSELSRMWEDDLGKDVVVFGWATWLSEYLAERWPQPLDPIALPRDKEGHASEDTPEAQESRDLSESSCAPGQDASRTPKIITGPAFEMKKSVFVGHVARVKTAGDVEAVRSTLLQDKKIAQATHNILAYRIKLENGSISQDNDDDGETAAGKRLGHLLQLLGAEDVMVVVTRWYGGTHLGPDRFKLINNAARQALDSSGYLVDSQASPQSQRTKAK